VIVLREWVSTFTERWTLVLGVLYILTMLLVPDGITGLAARLRALRRTRSAGPADRDEDRLAPAAAAGPETREAKL
jgi:hypothetical protein